MEDSKQTEEQKNEETQEQGDEMAKFKEEMEACKKQAEEYLNGWKRAKADYINFKNETEAVKGELVQYAVAGVMIKILPVYDGLKRACQNMPSRSSGNNTLSPERAEEARAMGRSASGGEGWTEGILNIKKQFEDVFKKFGVEEIKTVGEKFNPEFHEAVSREKRDGVAPDMVVEEVSGGYTVNGKTIIAAKVIVSE